MKNDTWPQPFTLALHTSCVYGLPLSLLMPGVDADNAQYSLAFNELALIAPLFYRCFYFHTHTSSMLYYGMVNHR